MRESSQCINLPSGALACGPAGIGEVKLGLAAARLSDIPQGLQQRRPPTLHAEDWFVER